jgi:uncharacterized membrane protein YhaH (DUF805 family)
MNFWQAIRSGFYNYVTFSGRAMRSEYWYWVLFSLLCGLATEILDAGIFSSSIPSASPLNGVFNLLTFLPSLALSVRRLHDIDRTGWWVLFAFTIIGIFFLIYWACKRGTPGPNRFGPDPFAVLAPASPNPTA